MSDGGPSTSYSSRPHHAQDKQEKPEEKKTSTTVSSSRPTVDYREYREKKERERLEREKAAASATTAQSHVADPSKLHSHHHKPVSNASMPNKHQVPSMQKGTGLHHNHHHRLDMKVGQPIPQRHSTGGQLRESSRDPNRQRMSREYNAGSAGNTSSNAGAVAQSHASVAHQSRDANLDVNLDSAAHRSDIGAAQDGASHGNPQEKPPSNNNYSMHRLNALDSKQAYDKRMHDPRHSKPAAEHKKDSEQKAYGGKYPDSSRADRQQRKQPDRAEMEQRCEEVRKLIEKPLPPPPKPTDVVPYMMGGASKQAHHAKYNQSADKSQTGVTSLTADAKHATLTGTSALSQEKSPSAPPSAPSQVLQKATSVKTVHSQHTTYGVSQILKDTIKNGNNSQTGLATFAASGADEPKSEKRPRYDDSEKSVIDAPQHSLPSQQQQHTPPSRHRSLFSPETPTTKEPHVPQRPKSKQKTPPSAIKAAKQHERALSFASPQTMQQQQDSLKRPSNDTAVPTSHKRLRTTNVSENEQSLKEKTEDALNLEANMRLLGRVPELIQPIRDVPTKSGRNGTSSSSLSASVANVDPKPLEQLVKPFELGDPIVPRFNATTMTQHKASSSMSVQATLTNGFDVAAALKQDLVPEHHPGRKEQAHRVPPHIQQPMSAKPDHSHTQQLSRLEYSPMKSAQSISALLQEPLAPMPSLLQGMHSQMQPHQQTHQEQQLSQQLPQQLQQQQPVHHLLADHQLPTMMTQTLSASAVSDNVPSIASTVDMSALSCVPLTHQPQTAELASQISLSVSMLPAIPPAEEKRSEHHKSEKKKKEKKHKHKDKDKNREKHKHKHKDKDKEKDKERHRERDKEKVEETPATAAPIKITIPKDKLNLSTETSPTVAATTTGIVASLPDKSKSPQGTGLKIKIPKERLKGPDNNSVAQPVVQGPLKIKIRTDHGISRSSATPATILSPAGIVLPLGESSSESSGRKRERNELTMDGAATTSSGGHLPPTKKQISVSGYGQGHRPGERQNGRHYSSGSNNKVRGGGRGGRPYTVRGPPPLATAPYAASQRGGGDDYYQRDSYGSSHARGQTPYPCQSLPTHGEIGYARGGHVGQTRADSSYLCANYPPHTLYNPNAGYIYEAAFYQPYQPYQRHAQQSHPSSYHQQPYSAIYPTGSVIITSDGAIDTSVPPPTILHRSQSAIGQSAPLSVAVRQQSAIPSLPLPPPPPPPPLPCGPPPRSTPPPPPPPE